MAFDLEWIIWSKVISLLIFVTVYLGALVYAFNPRHREQFERMAGLPLLNDEEGDVDHVR